MRRWVIYAILAVILVGLGLLFDQLIIGALGALIGIQSADRREKAQKRIEEAGDEVDEEINDSDDALNYLDDYFNSSNSD